MHVSPEISSSHSLGKTLTSRLPFDRVRRDMDGLYRCIFYFLLQDGTYTIFISNFGRLNVHYFLDKYELHCYGPDSLLVQESESVFFKCEGSMCNPAVKFEWRTSSTNTSIFELFQNETITTGQVRIDTNFSW